MIITWAQRMALPSLTLATLTVRCSGCGRRTPFINNHINNANNNNDNTNTHIHNNNDTNSSNNNYNNNNTNMMITIVTDVIFIL